MAWWWLCVVCVRLVLVGNPLQSPTPVVTGPEPAGGRNAAAVAAAVERPRPDGDAEDHSALRLDRFRARHPELYAPTSPPPGPVRVPGEFEPVDAVYYAWERGTAEGFFHELTRVLLTETDVEVILLHHGRDERRRIERYLEAKGDDPAQVSFADVGAMGPYFVLRNTNPYNRSLDSHWTTDWGPLFVENGSGTLAVVDFRYAWWRPNDDALPTKLAAKLGARAYRPDLELDGGNLLADGAGTCFTASDPMELDPAAMREVVDRQLKQYLGCKKVIRLQPLAGEPTGHVDMFLQIASPATLLIGQYDPDVDPVNAEILDENARRLLSATNPAGKSFDVRRVPMPENSDGVFRTHTNGIIVNEAVVVPVYPLFDPERGSALRVYRRAFPGRAVVTVNAEDIIDGGGAVRCVARTRPKFSGGRWKTRKLGWVRVELPPVRTAP